MSFKWIESDKLQEKYAFFRHKSGLPVYVVPKDFSSTYAIFATKYGSLQNSFKVGDESDFLPVPDGVAHFLEHKMFEEEDGSDAFDKFAPFGASANAFTSFDMTAYLFSTTNEVYDPLRILLSFVSHPHFTDKNVAKEQGIIGQEIAMCEDRPGTRLYYETMRALYKDNPITVSICGTKESIAEITPAILYRCYHAFYQLSNMVLCVVGRVDPEKVLAICDEILPEKPALPFSLPIVKNEKGIADARRTVKMAVAEPIFMIGLKDDDAPKDPELLARRKTIMSILNSLLFSASSPLHARLYDTGLITEPLSADYEAGDSYAHNLISGTAKDPEKVYTAIMEYLREVKKNLPPEEDFLRTRRARYANEIRFFDKTEDIGDAFVEELFDGTDIFRACDRILSLTYSETMQLFAELFREESFCMATVTPVSDERGITE